MLGAARASSFVATFLHRYDQFEFHLRFASTASDSPGQPISADIKRNITALAAKLDPKPVTCRFDYFLPKSDFAGRFYLQFIVEADTQFEATEIAASVSEQATKLDFPGFEHQTTNPRQHDE